MGSMHTGLEEEKDGFRKLAAFYEARSRGGVGLIVTGGFAPNFEGRLTPFSAGLTSRYHIKKHRQITDAVHGAEGKICLQILHAGRYAHHPFAVAPSAIRSPISRFRPWAMPRWLVKKTIRDFVRCASLAKEAGYDGVEVMGSEGYLLNEFITSKTNLRKDEWGGSYANRIKLAVTIVSEIRKTCGNDFIIIYRLSMLDLVEEGSSWDEVVILAKEIEKAGASIINTGIGWHEARIPTIAMMVPRAGFAWVTKKLKGEIQIPLVTSNRINTPELAEKILEDGCADMVSLARPFLADPEFVNKSFAGRENEINTCVACNQACLDHIFNRKTASCLVNPFACRETELKLVKSNRPREVLIIGAGVAGLSAAVTAALRGHRVTVIEKSESIGGQLNMARKIPGKSEFDETIRYYETQLRLLNIHLVTGCEWSSEEIEKWVRLHSSIDSQAAVIISSGVNPRRWNIDGAHHPKVLSYPDVLQHGVPVGKKVAVVGAGGIGVDTAEFLLGDQESSEKFYGHWGIDKQLSGRGGLLKNRKHQIPAREIYILKRSAGKIGEGLGKTTAWIHRLELKYQGVKVFTGVEYKKVDDEGLHILVNGENVLLEVDHVVVCAGQESENGLLSVLNNKGFEVHAVGGAKNAAGIDAKRAIEEGTKTGLTI